jgi:alkylated DNA repair dioxygenase AlkB
MLNLSLLLDLDIEYYENFLSTAKADSLFLTFCQTLKWTQGYIQLFGLKAEPRLSCWYGDIGAIYTYSQKKMSPLPWTRELYIVKCEIEEKTGYTFNSALCNLYRNGNDSMGWHSDDEPELGKNPVIASLSLGATRKIVYKHKLNKKLKHELELKNGSLLIMKGSCQHEWLHQIPKQPKIIIPRINITFRKVYF